MFYRLPLHTISVEAKEVRSSDLREKLANKELEGRRVYFVRVSAQP